ncbi:MAG: GGDEF domain-containing protein [Betaproteobacteria bacterium]|nr:GGDEF domain-containing protein [Betaproteobacteria bacterium]
MSQGAPADAVASPRIGIYGLFDRIPFLKGKYAQKFAAATVIAVVPPLVILAAYLAFAEDITETGRRLLPALGLTYLGGFMAMLWLHQGLLAPVVMSSAAMKEYLDDGKAPQMPVGFRDDAGRLMGRTQYVLELLERWGARIESLTDLDDMTGVYTRRAGEKRLGEEIARSERDMTTFHASLVDLRGFRAIRETHGYGAGDLCLVQLVADLVANTRKGDWVARWGNDRFLLGLHRNRNAKLVTDRILFAIDAVPCRVAPGKELPIRVSCAVMQYRLGMGEDLLLKRLEEALAEAKFKGVPDGPSQAVFRLSAES